MFPSAMRTLPIMPFQEVDDGFRVLRCNAISADSIPAHGVVTVFRIEAAKARSDTPTLLAPVGWKMILAALGDQWAVPR